MRRTSARDASARARFRPRLYAPPAERIPEALSVSTVMTWWCCAREVVALCSASRRMAAARAWVRPVCLLVLAQRFDGGLLVLVTGSQGPCWRAALRWSARRRPRAGGGDFGAGTRAISRPPGAATTRREPAFTPASTLTAGTPALTCAGAAAARRTMTWNEQNHRPDDSSDRVPDRTRAVPASIRRASFRVDSCVRIRPTRGRVT